MSRAFVLAAAALSSVLACAGAAASAPAAPAAAAPSAASDPIGADVRCLLIATSMATSGDAQAQTTGNVATFYYLGRLEGRISDSALEDRMFAEIPKLQSVGQAEAQRCAQGLSGRSNSYQAIGGRLEKRLGPATARPATPPKK